MMLGMRGGRIRTPAYLEEDCREIWKGVKASLGLAVEKHGGGLDEMRKVWCDS